MLVRLKDQRLDKTAFSVARLKDAGDDRVYWATKTIEERLLAGELIRQSVYGYDPAAARLQRVLEVTRRQPR